MIARHLVEALTQPRPTPREVLARALKGEKFEFTVPSYRQMGGSSTGAAGGFRSLLRRHNIPHYRKSTYARNPRPEKGYPGQQDYDRETTVVVNQGIGDRQARIELNDDFYTAVRSNDMDKVRAMIDLVSSHAKGFALEHWADSAEIVQVLFDHGAKLPPHPYTFHRVIQTDPRAARIFLKHGADITKLTPELYRMLNLSQDELRGLAKDKLSRKFK